MKFLTIALLVLLSLGSTAGCKQPQSKPKPEIKWQKYVDKEDGISFEYPDGWHIEDSPIGGSHYQFYDLSITSYPQISSDSNVSPYLNYPEGGISILLVHNSSGPGGPTNEEKKNLKRHVNPRALSTRTRVKKVGEYIIFDPIDETAPYISDDVAVSKLNSNTIFRFDLRTDKKGKALGEKVFNHMVKSFKLLDK